MAFTVSIFQAHMRGIISICRISHLNILVYSGLLNTYASRPCRMLRRRCGRRGRRHSARLEDWRAVLFLESLERQTDRAHPGHIADQLGLAEGRLVRRADDELGILQSLDFDVAAGVVEHGQF